MNKVLLILTAPVWCPGCKVLHKTIEDNTFNDIDIQFVDIDLAPDIAKEHGVRSVPTLILFRDGVEFSRTTGNKTLSELQMFIGD